MNQNDGDKFTNDLNDRLGELFNHPDLPMAKSNTVKQNIFSATSGSQSKDDFSQNREKSLPDGFAHFSELKSIILSIEWEITDETMRRLVEETDALEQSSGSNPLINSFLKLLGSVGKYILKNRGNAHPDSIQRLHSIYARLETVLTSPDMAESEVKLHLAREIQLFKQLRQKLLDRKLTTPSKRHDPKTRALNQFDIAAEKPIQQTQQPIGTDADIETLLDQIDAIEKRMKNEFEQIRALLKTFRQLMT